MYKFAIALTFMTLPVAGIACEFCSSSTVLSQTRAACFEDIFEDRLSRLERSGRGFVQVDLDSCGVQDSSDTRGTVGTAIDDRSAAYAEGGVLILTEAQMYCLRALMVDLDGKLDPELLVEIPAECSTP